jgi:hypothetical protein
VIGDKSLTRPVYINWLGNEKSSGLLETFDATIGPGVRNLLSRRSPPTAKDFLELPELSLRLGQPPIWGVYGVVVWTRPNQADAEVYTGSSVGVEGGVLKRVRAHENPVVWKEEDSYLHRKLSQSGAKWHWFLLMSAPAPNKSLMPKLSQLAHDSPEFAHWRRLRFLFRIGEAFMIAAFRTYRPDFLERYPGMVALSPWLTAAYGGLNSMAPLMQAGRSFDGFNRVSLADEKVIASATTS